MKIVHKKTSELKEYENNPIVHDKKQIEVLAKSIKDFGFKVPIVIDTDNVIIAGHGRLMASKKLKLKEVPCIVADDLTPEQIKKFRLVDNKTADLNEWDFDLLNFELGELDDMDDFGFDDLNYSDKNKEIDVSEFDDEMRIVLKYSSDEYSEITKKLSKYADDPSEAVRMLLNE